jgi:hypothetical protein
VTVCIPTRNRAQWLPEAIESVLAQTYRDFVLVISDNASVDSTPEVVAAFRDPRLVYIRHPRDVGLLGNFNYLLERVATEYSLQLPDDDVIYPRLLERTVRALDEHPRAGMAHCGFDVTDARGAIVRRGVNWTAGLARDAIEPGMRFIEESIKYGCRVHASSALMRMAALPSRLFDPADFPPADLGLWLRMALDWDVAFVSEPLGRKRIHSGSHSAAIGHPTRDGYIHGFDQIDTLLEVKLRFLGEGADRLPDPGGLRGLASQARKRDLYLMARQVSLPDRRLVPTARALARATRREPRMLADGSSWRLLGASVVGRRVIERVRGGDGREGVTA